MKLNWAELDMMKVLFGLLVLILAGIAFKGRHGIIYYLSILVLLSDGFVAPGITG